MSHCLPSPPPKPAAPTFQIAASSKQTQLITGPSLAVGTSCFSRTAVTENLFLTFERSGIDVYEDVSAAIAGRAALEVTEPTGAETKEEVGAGVEDVEL